MNSHAAQLHAEIEAEIAQLEVQLRDRRETLNILDRRPVTPPPALSVNFTDFATWRPPDIGRLTGNDTDDALIQVANLLSAMQKDKISDVAAWSRLVLKALSGKSEKTDHLVKTLVASRDCITKRMAQSGAVEGEEACLKEVIAILKSLGK